MDFYFGLICTSLLTLANAHSLRRPIVTVAPTAYPEFDNCGFNLSATCNDKMELFADGDLLATSDNWKVTTVVHIPPNTQTLQINCIDGWILGGILASSDNGLITNGAWNCSSDNGTTWHPAHELWSNEMTLPEISSEAKWIWTNRPTWTHTQVKPHTTAICKIELETSQCPDPNCPPFTNPTPTTTPIPTPTTTPSPSTSKPGFNLTATCDDKMKLFVDGSDLANSSNWRDASQVMIPANTQTIEIHCIDSGILGGILASSDNGLLTDGAWNCSSDNGTTWSPAYEVGPNGNAVPEISPDAEWIWTGCIGDWTSKYTGEKHRNNVICKVNLEPVIDGRWSAWSGSLCSATCGNATGTLRRTCSNPPPSNGGKPCHGLEEKVVSCGLSPCNHPAIDKYIDCPKWKEHCKDGHWTDCMNKNCPKTCKYTTTPPTTTETSTSINDIGTCNIEESIKYVNYGGTGNNINSTIVEGINACVKWCKDTIECQVWSFRKSNKKCWIKKELFDKEYNVDFISGNKICESTMPIESTNSVIIPTASTTTDSTFLVIAGDHVVESFNDIENAKANLMKVTTGSRLIAEVNSNGSLKRDPHQVGGQNQVPAGGFNKWWGGWDDINRMMDVAQQFLNIKNVAISSTITSTTTTKSTACENNDGSPNDLDCCKTSPCQERQGDCDNDSECAGSLICGKDNCKDFNAQAHSSADCCMKPLACENNDGSLNDMDCCKTSPCQVKQGDCDNDSECAGSLICGKDNCKDFNPQAHKSADCCIKAAISSTTTSTTTTKSIACENNDGSLNDMDCCKTSPCQVKQGDCDNDSECAGSLICGKDNCKDFNPQAHKSADCCIKG